MDVLTTLSDEVFRIEKESIDPISSDVINDIISIIKQSDKELVPILEVMHRLIENCEDSQLKTISVLKILKFYGVNNYDILSCRQKIVLEDKTLSKKPFLKKSQRENLETLLEVLNVEVK